MPSSEWKLWTMSYDEMQNTKHKTKTRVTEGTPSSNSEHVQGTLSSNSEHVSSLSSRNINTTTGYSMCSNFARNCLNQYAKIYQLNQSHIKSQFWQPGGEGQPGPLTRSGKVGQLSPVTGLSLSQGMSSSEESAFNSWDLKLQTFKQQLFAQQKAHAEQQICVWLSGHRLSVSFLLRGKQQYFHCTKQLMFKYQTKRLSSNLFPVSNMPNERHN